ncbi:MAG: class I SAM-dependent methyltransferase [Acidimicrobiales bacterium]
MAEFDRYADSYGEAVARSVSFAGQGVEYYARLKAEHLLDLVERRLGDPARLSALDVGCGVGITDTFLAGGFAALHGVDTAAEAIDRAGARNPTVRYLPYDGSTLPFLDGELDVAFAICVVHHVPPGHRHRFAVELGRVVRPGGLVVLFEHNPYNPLTRVAVSRCEFDEGVTLLSRRTASDLLTGAGLDVVERRFIAFLPLDRPLVHRAERALHRIPLGAQHYVAARRG